MQRQRALPDHPFPLPPSHKFIHPSPHPPPNPSSLISLAHTRTVGRPISRPVLRRPQSVGQDAQAALTKHGHACSFFFFFFSSAHVLRMISGGTRERTSVEGVGKSTGSRKIKQNENSVRQYNCREAGNQKKSPRIADLTLVFFFPFSYSSETQGPKLGSCSRCDCVSGQT